MSANPFRMERAWRLTPLHDGDAAALVRIRVGASEQSILAPSTPGLRYIITPRSDVAVAIDSAAFRAERLDMLPSLWARLRLALLFKRKKVLRYMEFSLFASGPRAKRKHFTRFNQDMTNIGLSVDGSVAARHPELLTGWGPAPALMPTKRAEGASDVVVVLHVYYEDAWPDLEGALRQMQIPFDLIVTTVAGRDRLAHSIRSTYPDADIIVMDNRGRDVRPFLVLLESGRLDRYRYVCKAHGKKSSDGDRKYLGALWRRRMLFDLIAGPGLARRITALF